MYKKDGFITPSEHVNFLAKNLFGACGQIVNGAIAYLAPDGGGPVTPPKSNNTIRQNRLKRLTGNLPYNFFRVP